MDRASPKRVQALLRQATKPFTNGFNLYPTLNKHQLISEFRYLKTFLKMTLKINSGLNLHSTFFIKRDKLLTTLK